jgi:hypothetical protein
MTTYRVTVKLKDGTERAGDYDAVDALTRAVMAPALPGYAGHSIQILGEVG